MSFRVIGMYCAACAEAVKNSVSKVPGVLSADLEYDAQRLKVTAAPGTPPEAVLKAVAAAGHNAEYLNRKEDTGPSCCP